MKLFNSAFCVLHSALGSWLPDMDLNHDKQIQSLLCYRYTIGQTSAIKIRCSRAESRLPQTKGWIGGLLDYWEGFPRYRSIGSWGRSTNPSIQESMNRI